MPRPFNRTRDTLSTIDAGKVRPLNGRKYLKIIF
jgi:hypothetical protein